MTRVYFSCFKNGQCYRFMLCEKGGSATPYANKKLVASSGTKTRLFKHAEHIQSF